MQKVIQSWLILRFLKSEHPVHPEQNPKAEKAKKAALQKEEKPNLQYQRTWIAISLYLERKSLTKTSSQEVEFASDKEAES